MEVRNPILEDIVKKYLNAVHPSFNPQGMEYKMFRTAVQDLRNWLKVQWHVDEADFGQTFLNFLTDNNGMVVKEEFEAFLSLWFTKWKVRVRIVFNDDELWNKQNEQLSMLVHRGEGKLTLNQIKELKDPVIEYLIERGEICCTEDISTQTIKQEAVNIKGSLIGLNEKVKFLNRVFNRIKDLASTKGPLVWIKVNGDLFKLLDNN